MYVCIYIIQKIENHSKINAYNNFLYHTTFASDICVPFEN
jgi:hypothetical protein